MSLILFDPTESSNISPALSLKVTYLPNLEERTGADFVLSTWDAPADNDALLWQHVERGAGFQLKRGDDLVESVFDTRLINQLSKMLEWWKTPWLLHHATVGMNKYGDLTINGKKAKLTYKAYLSTLRAWQRCEKNGSQGRVVVLDSSYSLDAWVGDELERMAGDKEARIVPPPKPPEKMEIESEDGVILVDLTAQERTLATFPGVGPMRAHALWEALPQHGARQTLLQAFVWMTDGYVTSVPGFGKGIERAAREHLGVREGERLWVEGTGGWQRVNDVVEIRHEE